MIMDDALPRIKSFFKATSLKPNAVGMLIRLVAAFTCHVGRMSAAQAAGSIRSQARHRAALVRFLAQLRWSRDWTVLTEVAGLLLQAESQRQGTWVFLVDQTYCGQQGQKTENTFSRANYRPRPKKGQRRQKKHAKRSCHGFVMGLLLTPSGLRIPSCRSYYTEAYCTAQKKPRPYRKQTELAADLIRAVAVPEGAEVVVLGDTAFDADVIRAACAERRWAWIVPLNPERVLEQAKPRPKVSSLVPEFSAEQFTPVRLDPGAGPFVAQRRVARCRLGPKVKTRTFYVHAERRLVHSLGEVQLLFSTKVKPEPGVAVTVQKILVTNDLRRTAAALVDLYTLRWQIELFFKELKSTLGLHQYRFRRFRKVEAWVQACLIAFVYLEWYRARQLRRRDLNDKDRRWWQWQRMHGLCTAVRQAAEENDLTHLFRWSGTKTGRKKLRQCLRAALPTECRAAVKNQKIHVA
jgi:Transposase DDE domain